MWRFACAFGLGGALSLLACQSSFQEDCPVGSENCACNEDGACIEGLICLSDVCVDESGTEAESDASSTTDSEESGDASSSTGETTDTSDTTDTDSTTGPADGIILWVTAATYTGDFDMTGDLRADFNAICQGDLPDGAGCIGTTAIVSTAQEDGLGSLENNAGVPSGPVVTKAGETVADSFATLLEEGPIDSLANLGAVDGKASVFWTGADGNGHFDDTSSCTGWTSGSDGTGKIGSTTMTGGNWLSAGDWACNEQASVLCACW